MHDRDDLWSLLASIVEHKALKVRSRQGAAKRGGGRTRVGLDMCGDLEADPSYATLDMLSLEIRELLNRLGDDRLKQIVIMILHGFTNAEIAQALETTERTIERKRLIIRRRWSQELEL